MKPAKLDLEHYGEDGLEPFTITILKEDVTPVDLTGASAYVQVKKTDGTLMYAFSSLMTGEHKLTIQNAGIVLFPTIKKWTVGPGEFVYDLKIIFPSGLEKTYVTGKWVFKKGVLISKTF